MQTSKTDAKALKILERNDLRLLLNNVPEYNEVIETVRKALSSRSVQLG